MRSEQCLLFIKRYWEASLRSISINKYLILKLVFFKCLLLSAVFPTVKLLTVLNYAEIQLLSKEPKQDFFLFKRCQDISQGTDKINFKNGLQVGQVQDTSLRRLSCLNLAIGIYFLSGHPKHSSSSIPLILSTYLFPSPPIPVLLHFPSDKNRLPRISTKHSITSYNKSRQKLLYQGRVEEPSRRKEQMKKSGLPPPPHCQKSHKGTV